MAKLPKAANRRDEILPWAQGVDAFMKRTKPMWGSHIGNAFMAEQWKDSKRKRRNLQVVYGKVTTPSVGVDELLVYGGSWYTEDGTQYPLYDTTTASNKTSYFDFVSATFGAKVSMTCELIIARDDTNTRCTVHVEEQGNHSGTYDAYMVLATFTLDANGAVSTQLQENWQGGNIVTSVSTAPASSVTRPYDYTQLTDTTFKIDAQYYEKTINVGGVWTDLDPIFWYASGFTFSSYDFESDAISAATWVYLSIDISSVSVGITITAATTCPDGTDTVEVVPLYKVLWDGSKISGVVDYRHNMRLPLMR